MNPAIKRASAFTILILLLTASVWIIVYFGNQFYSAKNIVSNDQVLSKETIETTKQDIRNIVTESHLELGVNSGDTLSNPFSLPATSTFAEDRSWIVVDAYENIIASGTIPGLLSSYNSMYDVYWMNVIPKSESGELRVLAVGDSTEVIIPVKLQTETQTVEIYFRPAFLSNCSDVVPVKRKVVATMNDLDYYQVAIQELLKGPNKEELESGLVTMIPPNVDLLRIGKNEQGRYIADFSARLKDPDQIDCFWNIAKQQIQKTLSTVPLQGRVLEGIILINGNIID